MKNYLLQKNKKENILFYGCMVVAFVFLCVQLHNCFFGYFWFDEVYSLYMIENSFVGAIEYTALDVHPPLYYLILKVGVDFIKVFNPAVNVIIVAKIVSMISAIITFFVCYLLFSKEFGKGVASVFAMMFFAFNCMTEITTEIRMYGYASLFVLMTFYYAAKVIRENGKTKDFILLLVFFVCSAYSHNYSLIASAFIVVYVLLYFLVCNRQKFLKAFIFSCLMAVLYIPWLIVLLKQIGTIHNNYWIERMPILSIFKYAFFFDVIEIPYGLAVGLVIAFMVFNVVAIVLNARCKQISKENKWVAGAGFSATFGVFAFGILFSILVDPIFIERYSSVVVATYFLASLYNLYLFFNITLKVDKVWWKHLKMVGLCVVLLSLVYCSINNVVSLTKENISKEKNENELSLLLENEKYDYVVMSGIMAQEVFEYRYPELNVAVLENYNCYSPHNKEYKHDVLTYAEIKELCDGGKNVVFLGKSSMLAVFEENNISYNLVGKESGYIVGMDKLMVYVLN